MWAINKSPLIIGAAVDPERLNKHSLDIMSNKEVIAINQDPLAEQAQLVRRFTEEEYDIWLSELSGYRQIIGVPNWKNNLQSVEIDLASLGIASAQVRDVWAAKDLGSVEGTQRLDLADHELRLWLVSDAIGAAPLTSSGYHTASDATLIGSATVTACSSGSCLPVGSKVGNIAPGSGITFQGVSASSTGKKTLGVDFINYDYAFTTTWEGGDNARNATISVNGGEAERFSFSPSGGNWEESGCLVVEADGFLQGADNTVVIGGFGNAASWAPDFVSVELLEYPTGSTRSKRNSRLQTQVTCSWFDICPGTFVNSYVTNLR